MPLPTTPINQNLQSFPSTWLHQKETKWITNKTLQITVFKFHLWSIYWFSFPFNLKDEEEETPRFDSVEPWLAEKEQSWNIELVLYTLNVNTPMYSSVGANHIYFLILRFTCLWYDVMPGHNYSLIYDMKTKMGN